MLSVTINRGVIRQSELLKDESKKDGSKEDKTVYKHLLPGDIVYNKMRAWQGAIGVSGYEGIVSPAYVVQRLRTEGLPRFYHHLFRTPMFAKEAERWSYGIASDMWSLRPEHFRRILSCAPPPHEQMAIVRYLQYLDRRVSRFVLAKQRLIRLLEERKRVTVDQIVTGRAESSRSRVTSEASLFEDLPSGWEIVRLKQVTTRLEQGWSPQCDAQSASEDEWGVLKVGCTNGDSFEGHRNKRLPPGLKPDRHLEIHDGDILVSRANTQALVGLAALAATPRAKLLLCDKLFRFRSLPDRADPLFLAMAIRSQASRVQIESRTNGASDSMQNIGQDVIRNLVIALPPVPEQRELALLAQRKTKSLAEAVSRTQSEIQLVLEYRNRLAVDAVTGRLDVRPAAASLSVETDDLTSTATEDAAIGYEDLDEVDEASRQEVKA